MYITLTAAFQNDDQPDFESLGITPSDEDFKEVLWDDLHLMYDSITTMNENEVGTTNIYLFNGQKWTVKESPRIIRSRCMAVVQSLPGKMSRISNK